MRLLAPMILTGFAALSVETQKSVWEEKRPTSQEVSLPLHRYSQSKLVPNTYLFHYERACGQKN